MLTCELIIELDFPGGEGLLMKFENFLLMERKFSFFSEKLYFVKSWKIHFAGKEKAINKQKFSFLMVCGESLDAFESFF